MNNDKLSTGIEEIDKELEKGASSEKFISFCLPKIRDSSLRVKLSFNHENSELKKSRCEEIFLKAREITKGKIFEIEKVKL